MIVDILRKHCTPTEQLLNKLAQANLDTKGILVMNKIDQIDRNKILQKIETFPEKQLFTKIFLISALKNDHLDDVINYIADHGQKYANVNNNFIDVHSYDDNKWLQAAEITRKYILLYVHQEIPYQVKVVTDEFVEDNNKIVIRQSIYVAKKSHKPMIIGQHGLSIARIGKSARISAGNYFNSEVSLFLLVKFDPKVLS